MYMYVYVNSNCYTIVLTISVKSWSTYSKKQYPLENVVPLSLTRLKDLSSPNDDKSSFTYNEHVKTKKNVTMSTVLVYM